MGTAHRDLSPLTANFQDVDETDEWIQKKTQERRPGELKTDFLCPLIEETLVIPPRDIRSNFLPKLLAIDFPNEVFPTPGGP